jgi:hypothetical protein
MPGSIRPYGAVPGVHGGVAAFGLEVGELGGEDLRLALGRPAGLALWWLNEYRHVPADVIVGLGVPDGPDEHVVCARHGPRRP